MNRILKTHPVRKKIRGCDLAEKKGEKKGGGREVVWGWAFLVFFTVRFVLVFFRKILFIKGLLLMGLSNFYIPLVYPP